MSATLAIESPRTAARATLADELLAFGVPVIPTHIVAEHKKKMLDQRTAQEARVSRWFTALDLPFGVLTLWRLRRFIERGTGKSYVMSWVLGIMGIFALGGIALLAGYGTIGGVLIVPWITLVVYMIAHHLLGRFEQFDQRWSRSVLASDGWRGEVPERLKIRVSRVVFSQAPSSRRPR